MKQLLRLILAWLLAFGACAACGPMPPRPGRTPTQQYAETALVDRALQDAVDALVEPARGLGVDLRRGKIHTLETEAVSYAAMYFYSDGHITLAYNRRQFLVVIRRHGYDAAVGIFAHEVGHLVDRVAEQPGGELSADAWAGCALAVRRANPGGLVDLMSGWDADAEHPAGDVRAQSVMNGYAVCSMMFP